MHINRKKIFIIGFLISLICTTCVFSAFAFDEKILGSRLSNKELTHIRGGLSGFQFGLFFSGYWEKIGNVDGMITNNGNIPEMPAFPQGEVFPGPGNEVAQFNGNGANIQAYVGNFNGASGIFQISQVPGSYNIVQNNLIVQLTVINVINESALASTLSGFTPW